MTTLSEMGEHEAIRRLTGMLDGHAELHLGAGDDCAIARLPGSGFDQVFTTDPVIAGVHFLPSDRPERIGNKAVGRVLSDIAAMGAKPQWVLVNVVAPPELDFSVLSGIYAGMHSLCRHFDATIIGGDLARGSCLELHVFGTGLVPSGSALLRSGAQSGDAVFVTGPLGCSITGKHLDFVPRVEEGIFLRDAGGVNAMIDISDGLATDLRHVLEKSGVGAILDEEAIPKVGTLDQALFDGEDFELLFAVSPSSVESLLSRWMECFGSKPVRIGSLDGEAGVLKLRDSSGSIRVLEGKAFEHFSDGGKMR